MFKTISFFSLFIGISSLLQAQQLRGVYSYTKGPNKAQGHAYLSPCDNDSLFIYLHAVGPAPDFEPEWLRAWIDPKNPNTPIIQNRDTFYVTTSAKQLVIKSPKLKSTSAIPGTYRLQTLKVKQLPDLLFPINPFWVKPARDSMLTCYPTPSLRAEPQRINFGTKPVQVVDSLHQFLLLEHPKFPHTFLWVQRQHCTLPNKK